MTADDETLISFFTPVFCSVCLTNLLIYAADKGRNQKIISFFLVQMRTREFALEIYWPLTWMEMATGTFGLGKFNKNPNPDGTLSANQTWFFSFFPGFFPKFFAPNIWYFSNEGSQLNSSGMSDSWKISSK